MLQVTFLCGLLASNPGLTFTPHGYQLMAEVTAVSIEYELPFNVVLAWLYNESVFDPKAVNARNSNGTVDRGVSMINSKYRDSFVAWFERKAGRTLTPYEIDEMNVRLGAFLLAQYRDRYGTVEKALARYNPGASGYAKNILGKSTGLVYSREVLPAYIASVFQKSSGKQLTLKESYAIMNTALLGYMKI